MMTTVLVTALSLDGIIGVAVGSSVVLIALILIPTVLVLKRRHKRALAELEQGLATNNQAAHGRDFAQQQRTGQGSDCLLSRSNGETSLLTGDSHNRKGSANAPFHRGHRRKASELLPWPLPRRRPCKRGVPRRSVIAPRLSAVFESPRGPALSVGHSPVFGELRIHGASPLGVVVTPPPAPSQLQGHRDGRQSPGYEPATWPLARRKQPSLLSIGPAQPLPVYLAQRSKPDRSFSLPMLLAPLPDVAMFGSASDTSRPIEVPRSVSHGNLRQGGDLKGMLAESPLLRFNNRDLKLGQRLPEHSSRSDASAGSPGLRQAQKLCDIDKLVEALSARAPLSLHEVVNRSSTETTPHKSQVRQDTEHSTMPGSFHGQICTADSVRFSTLSNPSGQSDPVTVIRVLSTPKRNAQMRHVSACGSPLERPNLSVLRDISGNELTPSKELSETSLLTFSSQGTGNPFKWEPRESPTQTRRSALKGSPASRGSRNKHHSVRIASTPTVFDIPNQSASSLFIGDIPEDELEDHLQRLGNGDENSETHEDSIARVLPRPPSTPVFAPQLVPNASCLRASLTPSSPTLSCIPLEPDFDIPQALHFQRPPKKSVGIVPKLINPTCAATEDASYVSFPTTSFSTDPKEGPSRFEDIPLDAPDSPTIPGLTSLNQRQNAKSALIFPTIPMPAAEQKKPETHKGSELPTAVEVFETLAMQSSELSSFPPGLSPSRKAGATTQLDTSNSSVLPLRPVPLSSSVDPSNTDPDFLSSLETPSKASSHPHGPRPVPPRDLLYNIKVLRRENSDAQYSVSKHPGAGLYLRMRPDGSIKASTPLAGAPLENVYDAEDPSSTATVWEDGEGFWKEQPPQAKTAGSKLPRPVGRQDPLGARAESHATRGAQETTRSLYDSSGFLKACLS